MIYALAEAETEVETLTTHSNETLRPVSRVTPQKCCSQLWARKSLQFFD